MSGGIDSSVTPYLLKCRGYDVEGVSFLMGGGDGASARCSQRVFEETQRAARRMGIRHDIIDVRGDFTEKVIAPFVSAYLSGVTRNPCVLCNRYIKFPSLLREADRRGADFIATGHYARIERGGRGDRASGGAVGPSADAPLLMKGIDAKKDQSYVLYPLSPEILRRLLLPLGEYRKDDVKRLAADLRLVPSECSESQEICFIRNEKYASYIQRIAPSVARPGPIVDAAGKIIGTHRGIYRYTLGQRKGLGIASSEPLYVVDIDIAANTVSVGPRDLAERREFAVRDVNWIVPPPVSDSTGGDSGEGEVISFRATVKVRSTMNDQPATVYVDRGESMRDASEKQNTSLSRVTHPTRPDDVRIVFDEPQWAPAPGQSAVFYDGDIVIGGGIISKPA